MAIPLVGAGALFSFWVAAMCSVAGAEARAWRMCDAAPLARACRG